MKRNQRKQRGQSMVEYALGIGCVAAVAMVALQGLGLTSADILRQVILSINDPNDQNYANNDPGGSPLIQSSAKPWQPQ